MKLKQNNVIKRVIGLIILLIGIWCIIQATSDLYEKSIIKEIKKNGKEVIGIVKQVDCEDTNKVIFEIDGYIEIRKLDSKCSLFSVGDTQKFLEYKGRFIFPNESISILTVILSASIGIILLLTGFTLFRYRKTAANS